MYWIFSVKFVDLGDSCTVGGDPAMNIIIARVPVLNVPEKGIVSGVAVRRVYMCEDRCVCTCVYM